MSHKSHQDQRRKASEHDFVDPVCGMKVSRNTAAADAEFQGKTYYFCAPACRERFLEEPDKYLPDDAETLT